MDMLRAKDWHQLDNIGARITYGFMLFMPVFKPFFSLLRSLAMGFVLFLNFLESHL